MTNHGVFGNFHRNRRQVNHFPRGGRHAGPGKALETRFARLPGLRRLAVAFGLQSGHPARPPPADGPPCQLDNPLLQALDDRLLPDADFDQDLPIGSPEVSLSVQATHIDITDTAGASL